MVILEVLEALWRIRLKTSLSMLLWLLLFEMKSFRLAFPSSSVEVQLTLTKPRPSSTLTLPTSDKCASILLPVISDTHGNAELFKPEVLSASIGAEKVRPEKASLSLLS